MDLEEKQGLCWDSLLCFMRHPTNRLSAQYDPSRSKRVISSAEEKQSMRNMCPMLMGSCVLSTTRVLRTDRPPLDLEGVARSRPLELKTPRGPMLPDLQKEDADWAPGGK